RGGEVAPQVGEAAGGESLTGRAAARHFGDIPRQDYVVLAAGEEGGAIGGEGERVDIAAVAAQHADQSARRDVPQADGELRDTFGRLGGPCVSDGKGAIVGGEGQRPDRDSLRA